MKRAILLSIVMLGLAVITSASDIKVHTYLVSKISPECVEVLVVVTNDIQGSETVIATGTINLGERCADQSIKSDKDSPKDLKETMKDHPEIQRRLDDWYDEYAKRKAKRE